MHIRTGQRATADTVDAWLSRHGVEVVAPADVYDACAQLLLEFDRIADLVLIGTDWLAPDDLRIVRYIRETWPRSAIVLYGGGAETAGAELTPFVWPCRTGADLARLVAAPPADVLRHLAEEALPRTLTGPSAELPALRRPPVGDPPGHVPPVRPDSRGRPQAAASDGSVALGGGPGRVAAETPRSLLTAEELAALLDGPLEG